METKTKTYAALRELKKALNRLDKTDEGSARIARRNARLDAFGALRRIENAIEAEYPIIEKEKKPLDTSLEAKAQRYTEGRFAGIVRDWLHEEQINDFDTTIATLIAANQLERIGKEPMPVIAHNNPSIAKRVCWWGPSGPYGDAITIGIIADKIRMWINFLRSVVDASVKRRTDASVNRIMLALAKEVVEQYKQRGTGATQQPTTPAQQQGPTLSLVHANG